MIVSSRWKDEYGHLQQFIAQNKEIVLAEREVSIPQTVREEFYRLFDAVRKVVVEDNLESLPVNARVLSSEYVKVEQEVLALLGLNNIGMPVDLHAFLHNPEEGLMRVLYGRLLDLLQRKITEDEFAKLSADDLAAAVGDLYRLGYERWAGLVMIKLLDPDQAFFVGLDEDFNPYLRELADISFGRQAHHPTKRIPEFVIHSRKFNSYIAVKMALIHEIDGYAVAFKPPVRPKKKTGDTSFALDSRVMLMTLMRDERDIPVYADIYECTRTSPDLAVEFISGPELQDPEALKQVQRHDQILNPKYGTSLIIVGESAMFDPELLSKTVRPVHAGFNQTVFENIVHSIQA